MLRILSALLVFSTVAITPMASAFADYQLTIVHSNDVHSRIEPVNQYDATCSEKDQAAKQCFGGVARIKAAVDARRQKAAQENGNLLVLDAGDQFQGSLFFTTYKGLDTAEFINTIGYDAMALGNHEFDLGQDGLAPFLDHVKVPILAANVETIASSPIHGKYQPYLIKTIGTQKVGIIGVVTPDTTEIARPGKDIAFTDVKTTIEPIIADLKSQGVNIIIALTHLGYQADQELAAQVDGIDVIVGGHSHTLLANDNARASGAYPTMISNPSGKKVPVVTAYAYSQYLGELHLDFDDNGDLLDASGALLRLDNSITPDATLEARVTQMAESIEVLKNKIVAQTGALIDGSGESCRVDQCAMGTLVTSAMLERVREQGISVALINGGALRASLQGGDISMGDVLVVLPFQNTVSTFQLSGSDLLAALENGVSQVEQGSGRYPQVAGLRFTLDYNAPAGQRIKTVQIQQEDAKWQPLDPNQIYGVAATDYLRSGGDGYAMIRDQAQKAYDYGPSLDQVVVEYLVEHSPYQPQAHEAVSVSTP